MAMTATSRLATRADHLGEGHEAATVFRMSAAALALVWAFLLLIAQENLATPLTWSDVSAITVMLFGAAVVSVGIVALDLRKASAHAAGAALVLSIVAVAGLTMYWTGLSIVLGSAALILGGAGRRHASGSGGGKMARAAQTLGLGAALVNLGILVVMTITNFAPALPR